MTCYRHPDRETGVSCSECGRGICPDCMVFAPVGIRCPDHSGQAQGAARVRREVKRAGYEGTGALVTKVLIGVNVGVFMVNLAQGASLERNGGDLFVDGFLIGRAFDPAAGQLIGVAEGQWWRLITATFLHGGLFHLLINMLMLWWIGGRMEEALGRARFIALYLVSGLAGSAGALALTDAGTPTVGASGAIFGILGAALVFERQRHYILGGSALSIVVLNLIITFTFREYISVGGHVGGLIGGALIGLALSRFGRSHAAYGRAGLLGSAGVAAVAVAALALSYLTVQSY
ncbi:MAG: rhomboid family intramembrane serine protease [Thermoleophilia bacterium]|nr:rhomboid family intramembrane serine protease [Thermoleophilia bacterium]